jgi:hypothetical protein
MKTPLSEKIKPMFLSPQNLWMIDEVKKLEKQVGHLLDLSKTLLQNIEPDKFANGVGLSVVMITREMWDDFQKLIADIEGENQ